MMQGASPGGAHPRLHYATIGRVPGPHCPVAAMDEDFVMKQQQKNLDS